MDYITNTTQTRINQGEIQLIIEQEKKLKQKFQFTNKTRDMITHKIA